MKRLFAFLVGNWPLKIGAIALATVLYVGVVVAQGERVWPGSVGISLVGAPGNATLVQPLPEVTAIRYRAPVEIASQLTNGSFLAEVDLSDVRPEPGGPPINVPVRLSPIDARVQILDYSPRSVEIRLDPVTAREMPVSLETGAIPDGLEIGTPQIQPATVRVQGASLRLSSVRRVLARVTVDGSAINVDSDVDLTPVDEQDARVPGVEVTPARARVRIDVARQLGTANLPVLPIFDGALPPGYLLVSAAAQPAIVTVSGEEPVVAAARSVPTEPIDLAGRVGSFQQEVGLAPPTELTVGAGTRVTVSVTIAPVEGSATFPTGLRLDGARNDREYRLSTADVQVLLAGQVATLDRLEPGSIVGAVDVSGLDVGSHELAVRVQAPPGTRVISISPADVAVTIQMPSISPSAPPSAASPAPSASAPPVPSPSPVPELPGGPARPGRSGSPAAPPPGGDS